MTDNAPHHLINRTSSHYTLGMVKQIQNPAKDSGPWSVADAKARLSEILRLARDRGPQTIGKEQRYVIVTEEMWRRVDPDRPPLGRWLIENSPGTDRLTLPSRQDSREIPFADETE